MTNTDIEMPTYLFVDILLNRLAIIPVTKMFSDYDLFPSLRASNTHSEAHDTSLATASRPRVTTKSYELCHDSSSRRGGFV